MDCVAQVEKESVASPAEPCRDAVVRELLSVEQVCCCDADGVRQPELKFWVPLLQV